MFWKIFWWPLLYPLLSTEKYFSHPQICFVLTGIEWANYKMLIFFSGKKEKLIYFTWSLRLRWDGERRGEDAILVLHKFRINKIFIFLNMLKNKTITIFLQFIWLSFQSLKNSKETRVTSEHNFRYYFFK